MGAFLSVVLGFGSLVCGSWGVYTLLNEIINIFMIKARSIPPGTMDMLNFSGWVFGPSIVAIVLAYFLGRTLSKGAKAMITVLIMLIGLVGLLLFSGLRVVLT
jgi:hypothetical protein